jgi:hypothetical protein
MAVEIVAEFPASAMPKVSVYGAPSAESISRLVGDFAWNLKGLVDPPLNFRRF